MGAKIHAISYWLPDRILSNAHINEKHPEWSIDKISEKTGINERRLSGPDEFVSDMACNAVNKLFEEHSNVDRNKIDFLLLCTQSPDYFLPTTACIVQNRLGLPKTCGALDFNLGCSGYVYGLGLAKGLIESGSAKNILLVTSETYSKFIHDKDKSNKTIFGDAASATLVSAEYDGFEIGGLVYGTDGQGAENLIVKNGGVRFRYNKGNDVLDDADAFIKNDDHLFMNGAEIFKFTASNVPVLVRDVLEKNTIEIKDVDLFIFHQANKFMLDFIRKKIGIDTDKFYYFLESCGNTVSSTIPIALKEAILERKALPGKKILLAGFGVGYSWAGCIIK